MSGSVERAGEGCGTGAGTGAPVVGFWFACKSPSSTGSSASAAAAGKNGAVLAQQCCVDVNAGTAVEPLQQA